jgi:N-acetylneuraminic acid mutarotase
MDGPKTRLRSAIGAALFAIVAACDAEGIGALDGGTAQDGASEPLDAARADARPAEDARANDDARPIEDAAIPDAEPADAGQNERGRWASCAPLARGARQETAVAAMGGEVYVIGGFTGLGAIVATVEAYDPVTDQWRDVPDLPAAVHHANAAAIGDRVYVLGFLRGTGFVADGRGWVLASGQWTPIRSMTTGTERGASGVAVAGGKIYVAGGYRAGSVGDFSVYDPSNDSWTELGLLPEPLDHLIAGGLEEQVVIAGGRSGSITGHRTTVRAFDPVFQEWTLRADLPTSRGGAAAAVLEGRLFVFGGEGNPTPGSRGVFPNTEGYDPRMDRWSVLEPMPTPRHGTGAASVRDRVVIPGGATQQAFGAVDTCEVFFPPP